ncbi:PREDICTED: uncharacterized protein LOC108614631 [Drosophila arizonae]|uniref:Uncharacterized protein LOC108614631 n=1 Tax=Drosophila arizonae TaxID=7263 RepID=A0ABM1PAU1_DROAR|nr:PREDICTED: uncharacterized protein LOC108614631 [Drosophila arizonae]
MYHADSSYDAYRRSRRKFSLITYLLLGLWLILALGQWLLLTMLLDMNLTFRFYYYISIVAFLLAIVLFAIFLFLEKARWKTAPAVIISILIVELQIIGSFTLVAQAHWMDMLIYFSICLVLIVLFAIIGVFLPQKMDLTLHVALLFIVAFLFLLIGVYFLLMHLIEPFIQPYAYLIWQISITITLMFFVMYHAQTINGSRFAEMRLHDYCLGSLILFHDFLIIYWLTLYWQVYARLAADPLWGMLSTVALKSNNNPKFIDLRDEDYSGDFVYIAPSKHQNKVRVRSGTTAISITLDFMADDMSMFSNPVKDKLPNLFDPDPIENRAYDFRGKDKDQSDQQYVLEPDESTVNPEDKDTKAYSRKPDNTSRSNDTFQE